MAKTSSIKDQFGQVVYNGVTTLIADTTQWEQFDSQINTNEKIAIIITEVSYFISSADIELLVDSSDRIGFGLAMWQLTNLNYNSPGILDYNNLIKTVDAAAVVAQHWMMPYVKTFTDQPGGGLIAHPASLWMYAVDVSIASRISVSARVRYKTTPLDDSMYRELYDMQIINSIIAGL